MAASEALDASAEASLLGLPPELRNEIYRLVLIKPANKYARIDAETSWAAEPALLHVCHQIRNEAIAIYYQGNCFRFGAANCDAADLIKWRSMSTHRSMAKINPRLDGAPSWINLKRWLRAYHNGRAPSVRGESSARQPYRTAVAKIFDFVRHMRDMHNGWARSEATLEKMHDVMAALDPAWK